jgi:hypothetical protein
MRQIFCIILATIIYSNTSVGAALEVYPKKCVPFVVQGTTLKIKLKPPAIVMVHNLSKHDIWMTHNTRDGVSAGWSSKLNVRRWSALALTKATFEMTCIESTPGHEQNIACEDAVAACVWSPAQLPEGSEGVFWAGENRSLAPLIAHIERRGFTH